MITIIYPSDVNWFYARLAHALDVGLRREGLTVRAVTAHEVARIDFPVSGTALVVSPAECAASLPRGSGSARAFAGCLRRFARRVLINYDSIHTSWFARHLALGIGLFTDLFDIGAAPQAEDTHAGLPYRWIREAQWLRPVDGDATWTPRRPLPWAIIGHADASRAALVSGLVRLGRPGGFVYLPPLRPYGAGSGLDAAGMDAILRSCDLYVWNSHHQYPYHEGIRAIQAVAAGAAPAKIDPFHAERFAGIPWVYPSLRALIDALEREGPGELHRRARAFVDRAPTLERSIAEALATARAGGGTSCSERAGACISGAELGLRSDLSPPGERPSGGPAQGAPT